MPAAEDAAAFCDALFAWVPPSMHANLWTRRDKRSLWVSLEQGPGAVAFAALRLAETSTDVYVGVSVVAEAGEEFARISSDNSAGIMGLWADIDVADPDAHKKWNLPPSEAAAQQLLTDVGLTPTLVVHSGHGLQAWWLFDEFWQFTSEEDRLRAAALAERWNSTLRLRAAAHSWTVDSTFDLARVMRVPGTENRKSTPIRPVQLLSVSPYRYAVDDFESFVVDDRLLSDQGYVPTRAYQPDAVELTEAADPPFEKLELLREVDKRFADTWERKRTDFSDTSQSSYDLALATLSAAAGWSDQEIANLIIGHRRVRKQDVSKALRVDYIRRTIAKARDSHSRLQSSEVLDDVIEDADEARLHGDDEDMKAARRAALDAVGAQLGLEVLHFIRYTSDPPTFRLVTPTTVVDLGKAEGILAPLKFREQVWAQARVQIDRFKQPGWDRITEAILRVLEDQDVGLEATDRGEVSAWLSRYLTAKPAQSSVDEAALTEYPYKDGAGLHIFGNSFRRWLFNAEGEKITAKDLGKRLRSFGATPGKVNITTDDARTTRSIWTLPEELLRG